MKNSKLSTTNIKVAVVSFLAATLMFGGMSAISAYFTDTDTATNTFTVGNVDAELLEPNYPGNNDSAVKDQVGNQETAKDPLVHNTGVNDAVVFIKVTVPVANVTEVSNTGTKGTKQNQELYYFKKATDAVTTHANNFYTGSATAKGWIELTGKETGTDYTGTTRTYVFGYNEVIQGSSTNDGSAQTVNTNDRTLPLFDKVQMKNILEAEVAAGTSENVVINAYVIQADNILNTSGVIPTSGYITAANLASIYDIYVAQNS